jgi:hypothetical protein
MTISWKKSSWEVWMEWTEQFSLTDRQVLVKLTLWWETIMIKSSNQNSLILEYRACKALSKMTPETPSSQTIRSPKILCLWLRKTQHLMRNNHSCWIPKRFTCITREFSSFLSETYLQKSKSLRKKAFFKLNALMSKYIRIRSLTSSSHQNRWVRHFP